MIESTITLLKKLDKRKKIEKDFEWVVKIVSSSENFNHIVISNVLSEEMEKLYGSNLTTKERIELVKAVLLTL